MLLKTKIKKSKRPKRIWMKPWLKNRYDKKHVLAYFHNFCWLTNSSMIFEWMLHHTIDHTMIFIDSLLFTFYITCTYNYTVCIDYFDALAYTNFYSSLQYTFFIFTNNFFTIMQLKQENKWRVRWLLFKKYFTERNF